MKSTASVKSNVEPVFGFLKANLYFTGMSVRGKEKVHSELGFTFMDGELKEVHRHEGEWSNRI